MTLWILSCRMSENMDILFAFYARNRDDAEQHARKIVREQGYERLDLKAYPYGFMVHRSRLSGCLKNQKLKCIVEIGFIGNQANNRHPDTGLSQNKPATEGGNDASPIYSLYSPRTLFCH
jgi:hypothetical protein